MTVEDDFKQLKIQTFSLRVNIHCEGCKQKVNKLLQRIEGVYKVTIDSEEPKVTVSGSIDPATLIKRLVKAGKPAELWSSKPNQNQSLKNIIVEHKEDNKAIKNKQKFPLIFSTEGAECFNIGEEEEEDGDCDVDVDVDVDVDEEFRLLRHRANQLGLLRNGNAKRGGTAAAAASNNGSSAGKKVNFNLNQNVGVDPKAKAMAALMANLGGGGRGGGAAAAEYHNEMNSVMNNPSSLASSLQQQGGGNVVVPNSSNPIGNGIHPRFMLNEMNGGSSPMMNIHGGQFFQPQPPQPQMMYQYQMSYVPPYTGFHYDVLSTASPYRYEPSNISGGADANMFNDDNTDSCSIM